MTIEFTVYSEERSTGMGATRFTAILMDSKWVRISQHPKAHYHGREVGLEQYSVDVPEGTPWATFYRSNSGKELITIHDENGVQQVQSFEDAAHYAACA